MAEFNISRFKYVWRGPWQNGTAFNQDDIAVVGGKIYVCLIGHIASLNSFDDDLFAVDQFGNAEPRWVLMAEGQRWRGSWTTSTKYETSEIVKYGATLYICNAGHTSAILATDGLTADIENWDFLARTFDWRSSWVSGRKYYIGDITTYGGFTYLCTQEHTSATITLGLEDDSEKWQLINRSDNWRQEWLVSSKYIKGDIVSYGGNTYRCIADHTANDNELLGLLANDSSWESITQGVRYRSAWQADTLYLPDDVVVYGNSLLKAAVISRSESFVPGSWVTYLPGSGYENIFIYANNYNLGDIVLHGGYTYRSTINNNQGNFPTVANTEWELLSTSYNFRGEYLDDTLYKTGDVVTLGGDTYVATQDTASYPLEPETTTTYTVTVQSNGIANKYYVNGVESPNLFFINSNTTILDLSSQTNDGHPMYFSTIENGHHTGGDYGYYDTGITYQINSVSVTRENFIQNFDTATQRSITINPDVSESDLFYPVCFNHSGMYNFNYARYVNDSASWDKIINGRKWIGPWDEDTQYYLGDITTYAGTSYVCIQQHSADDSSLVQPNLDDGSYWNVLVQGSATNVLVNVGDIKTRISDTDTNLTLGETGQVSQINSNNLLEWANFSATPNVFFVATTGQDLLTSGTEGAPFRTIKYACEYLIEDSARRPATIFVKTGTFAEILPIVVPEDVAIVGDELRSTVIKPAEGYELSNMFYMRNGSGLRNCTLNGLSGELGDLNEYLTRRPSAGAYVGLDPGEGPSDSNSWITNKSPYVQNVTAFGTGCIGMKVDGELHNGGNKSIVANDFTQILSDGIGYWANEEGRSELVSVFTYYCHIGYLCTQGGTLRATNGNNSYGDFGSVAEGVNPEEAAISANLDNRTKHAQVSEVYANQDGEIIGLAYSHAGQEYTTADYDIVGSGIGANISAQEFRQKSISEIRIKEPEDSASIGGSEFRRIENNAQIGSATSITLSASDLTEDTSYIGMNVFIKAGTGTGQWGKVSAYDPSTKVATISNMYDQSGWNTIIPGNPLATILDGTTRYVIEPSFEVESPGYVPYVQSTGSFKSIGSAVSNGTVNIITSLSSNVVAYSTNGTNWTNTTLPTNGDWIRSIWSGSKFITISSEGDSAESPDGINWSNAAIPNYGTYTDMASYKSTIIITMSGSQNIVVSTNGGTSWNTINTGKSGGFDFAAYDSNRFVITDANGDAYESLDNGSTWNALPSNILNGLIGYEITSFAGGNRAFVAAARDTSGILASRPVVSRSVVDQDLSFTPIEKFYALESDPSAISVGNWKLGYGGGLFFAIANNGLVNVSQDALNWKVETSVGGQTWGGVDYIEFDTENATYQSFVILNTSSSSDLNLVRTGARCVARPNIVSNRVSNFYILEPGSGYETEPAGVIIDSKMLTDATYDFRINNGVLPQPIILNSGSLYTRQSATVSGDGFADIFPVAGIIQVKNLLRQPGPGDALTFSTLPNRQFYIQKIENIEGSEPNLSAQFQITPILDINEAPIHDTSIEIRQKFSQIRLTGHDFLDIGSGNFTQSAYPLRYTEGYTSENEPRQNQETAGFGGGRVFYTSTDQDGNFRVGELFKVDQATGVVTISASQFDLTGIEELRIGGIVLGGTNAVVREFSTDPTFVDNSDNIVPTQRAIGTYITSRISSGGSNLNVNALLTSQLKIDNQGINLNENATLENIRFDAPVNLQSYSGLFIMSQLFTAP